MPEQLLIPVLAYPDVAEAVARLGEAFGFVERWRVGDHRAQLEVGPGAAIAVVQGGGPVENGDHVMVRVEDVDAHCATAREHGATILSEPAEMPYGERQYTARDHSGRSWVFTQTVADVAPEVWGGTSGPAT
jgi:hypothetical protein